MARLFTCGFEENNSAETMWNVGTATIEATSPHSGTYRGSYPGTAATWFRRDLATQYTSGTIYTRFYVNVSNAARNEQFIRWQSDGGSGGMRVEKRSTGVIRLTNIITSAFAETTNTIAADTWYRIETRHLISGTAGEMELRWYVGDSTTPLDTIQVGNADANTLPTNVRQVLFIGTSGTADTIRVDDVAINDANDTGFGQTSWVGPGKNSLITSNGDNAVTWTKAGSAPAATNWAGVDDVPGTPDDGTTYNFDSGTSNEERLNLTNLGAEVPSNATMILIDVYARISFDGTAGSFALKVWDDGGNGSEGASISGSSATWRIVTTNEHNYVLLTGKTKANLDSYSAGYKALTGAGQKRVSAIWANVEWIEGPDEVALSGSAATGGHGTSAPGISVAL